MGDMLQVCRVFLVFVVTLTTYPAQAERACDIEADACCAVFEELGMGNRAKYLAQGPQRVFTFATRPRTRHTPRPNPTIADPQGTKTVESASATKRLMENFRAQLVSEGASPALLARLTMVAQELVQNAADAHVRNGTDADTRQILVRLKIQRRGRPWRADAGEPVDQIFLEVVDNAGNPTAKKNRGVWFNGGRTTGEAAAQARKALDEQSAKLMNPVEIARQRGLTQMAGWQASKEYQTLRDEAEKQNAAILEKLSDAGLPPDLIADYFDAKVPDVDAENEALAGLSPIEAETREQEWREEFSFWLMVRFGIRAKEIAVEDRDGGSGGFGSILLKAWGARWVYGPHRNADGQVVGTRTVYLLETPSSPLAEARPIGYTLEPVPELLLPKAPTPATLILPNAPRRAAGPIIVPGKG